MSKKQKKQKQNNKLFLPLIILGGVLLIASAFYFANQGGDDSGTPSIIVDQQKIDYGDVKFDVEKTFAFKVTNTGDGTLRFKEEPYIEVLEGC
jgi:flagellar basal body-associated protein FliL